MSMSLRLLPVFLLLAIAAAGAHAQTLPDNPPAAQATPSRPVMTFEWMREGPADKCGSHCREWISAKGLIDANSARTFAEFTRTRSTQGATMVIESEGGSVSAAMTLGRLLRQLDISTTVGRTERRGPDATGIERAHLSPAAICASMCPFVVLGGAHRHIPTEARVLVHQIWPRLRREDAMAATYTAQDFVGLQRELGLLAKYVVEMGGDLELFEIALRIPPWEAMRPLSPEDLRRMKLNNIEDAFAPVLTGNAAAGASAIAMPAGRIPEMPDRGWTVSEGARGITRKHPLTVEGMLIGSFELSFTCGGQGITATYVEQRQAHADAQGDHLALVSVVSGKNAALRMTVRSSAPEGRDALRSTATAKVTAEFLDALAASDGRALMVGTLTMRRARTAIRPGNTGFADSFRRTLANCAK